MGPVKYGVGCCASLYLLGVSGMVDLTNTPLYDGALFGCLMAVSRVGFLTFNQVGRWKSELIPYIQGGKWLNPDAQEEMKKYFPSALKVVLVVAAVVIVEKQIMTGLGSPISYAGFVGAWLVGNKVFTFMERRMFERVN